MFLFIEKKVNHDDVQFFKQNWIISSWLSWLFSAMSSDNCFYSFPEEYLQKYVSCQHKHGNHKLIWNVKLIHGN